MNIVRQMRKEEEKFRLESCLKKLEELDYKPMYNEHYKYIKFYFNGGVCYHYPYTGWYQGKTIKHRRGFKNLLKQIAK